MRVHAGLDSRLRSARRSACALLWQLIGCHSARESGCQLLLRAELNERSVLLLDA